MPPLSPVTCALFQGNTRTKVLDQSTFKGNIAENYQDAMSYLLSHLNTEYVIRGGPREEILELPEEALREALLNAIGHRDYRSTSYIQVHIFQDRVETIEKGRPKGTDITPSTQPVDEGVNEGVVRLLSLIQDKPGMRTPQISIALDVPIKTLERWLKKLREEGKVEFRGSPKTGGYWSV